MYKIFWLFSSPCHRQRDLLPSLGVRRLLTFHILIFSSETPHPNELKLGRKHRYGRSSIKIAISYRSVYKHRCHRKFLFMVCRFLKHLKLLISVIYWWWVLLVIKYKRREKKGNKGWIKWSEEHSVMARERL